MEHYWSLGVYEGSSSPVLSRERAYDEGYTGKVDELLYMDSG